MMLGSDMVVEIIVPQCLAVIVIVDVVVVTTKRTTPISYILHYKTYFGILSVERTDFPRQSITRFVVLDTLSFVVCG